METETQDAPQRTRGWLLGVLAIVLVALVAYQMWPQPSPVEVAATPGASSPRQGAARQELDPAELKVKLDALVAKRPEVDEANRNPFRFRPPPPPPPPPVSPQSAKPSVPTGPPPEPLPPPIPPIPLKFMGTVEKPGLMLAALTDCKGYAYAAREGEVVDGRYRVVKIQVESVILEYSNGTGRTTVRKSGDCPRTQ
jgi:hypothetical protein